MSFDSPLESEVIQGVHVYHPERVGPSISKEQMAVQRGLSKRDLQLILSSAQLSCRFCDGARPREGQRTRPCVEHNCGALTWMSPKDLGKERGSKRQVQ